MRDLKNLNCLLPDTKKLLLEINETCPFLNRYVLVGGSALTLHLCHRKSEDLDFFTYDDSFSMKDILEYIKHFNQKEILNQTDEQIDILLNGVKVTFFNAKWGFLKPKKAESFNLASMESIATMKVNVLFLRAKYRDYYDLLFIYEHFKSLKKIFEYSSNIVEGVTFKLFCIALLYIDDIEDDNIDYLEPILKISKEEIRDIFEKGLKKR